MTSVTKTLMTVLGICGIACACSSNPLQRWSSDIDRARTAHAPILLYSVPFTAFPSLADVGVVNTSSAVISRFDIVVTGCWTRSETWELEFYGPVSAGQAASVKAMVAHRLDPFGNYYATVDKAPETLWVNRMIVKAVVVKFNDDRTVRIDRHLKNILASGVPNYCPARMQAQSIEHGNYVR